MFCKVSPCYEENELGNSRYKLLNLTVLELDRYTLFFFFRIFAVRIFAVSPVTRYLLHACDFLIIRIQFHFDNSVEVFF